jgi:cysteinyl-tRNA synthetase
MSPFIDEMFALIALQLANGRAYVVEVPGTGKYVVAKGSEFVVQKHLGQREPVYPGVEALLQNADDFVIWAPNALSGFDSQWGKGLHTWHMRWVRA